MSKEVTWTDDLVQQLTDLWSEGFSCSQIANALGNGLTRNSVIGKAHRLHLRPRRAAYAVSQRRTAEARAKARRQAKVKDRVRKQKAAASKPRIQRPAPAEMFVPNEASIAVGAWNALPDTTPVPLVMLTDKTCRWPIGGSSTTPAEGFCGCAVKEGSSYCETHHYRAHLAPPKKAWPKGKLETAAKVFA